VFLKILLITLLAYADSGSLTTLSFDQPDWISFHQSEVRICGFLYQTREGQWILASEPYLKSCCIGSDDKIDNQIVILGLQVQTPPSQAVTIQGIFFVDPTYMQNGELRQLYKIEKAQIISEPQFPLLTIAITLLLLTVVALFDRLKKLCRH
jgi:hypothetical protein